MTSIDLNSMTAMNLDGLPTKIAVNDLNVWYGKFHALKHITLAIPEGRVTAFIARRAAASRRSCAPSTACTPSIRASAPKAS